MNKLSFLSQHSSTPANQLHDPAPSEAEIKSILQAAMSAPDHGGLTPFRFLLIQGDARQELSRVFEDAARQRGADEAAIQKQKDKPLRSPLIIPVIARITDAPGIPEIEQILSAGCAAQHIQLACGALGYGSIWLTGENSYDLRVYEALGLDMNERIIGFIYVGTHDKKINNKTRMDATTLTESWLISQRTDFAI